MTCQDKICRQDFVYDETMQLTKDDWNKIVIDHLSYEDDYSYLDSYDEDDTFEKQIKTMNRDDLYKFIVFILDNLNPTYRNKETLYYKYRQSYIDYMFNDMSIEEVAAKYKIKNYKVKQLSCYYTKCVRYYIRTRSTDYKTGYYKRKPKKVKEVLQCHICGKILYRKSSLIHHIKIHWKHIKKVILHASYICPICERLMKHKCILEFHMQGHWNHIKKAILKKDGNN